MYKNFLFWNVAGLTNKDRDFWRYICNMDFVSLSETWVGEKDVKWLEQKLPNNFDWEIIPGKKEHKKGRAMGGFLIGINKKWKVEKIILAERVEDGLIKSQIRYGNKPLTIWSVYNSGSPEAIWQHLEEWDFLEEGIMLIGGDLNIRIGKEGNARGMDCIWDKSRDKSRDSKDKVLGNGWRRMVDFVDSKAWVILNGYKKGDYEGEFTYIGSRGSTVIDYVIVNEDTNELIEEFNIEESIDSDHLPLKVKMNIGKEENGKEEETLNSIDKPKTKVIYSWSEEDRAVFEEETKELDIGKQEGDTAEERWGEIKQIITEKAKKKEIKIKVWKIGTRRWWDSSCTKKKRKVRKEYIKWKNGIIEKESYIKERREWKQHCIYKEKEWKENEAAELRSIKNESEVWKFLNKTRRTRKTIENCITKEEWNNHFRTLLEGSAEKKVGVDRRREETRVDEEKVSAREIKSYFRKLKKKKAAGMDTIPNEVWIYGGEDLINNLICVIGKVWDGEEIPEDWKTAIIVPLYKKGDANKPSNYRGISLLSSGYKLYTELILGRLQKEVDEKNLLPEGQAGFRKGRSTTDNIYILNHIVQRAKMRNKRIYSMFVDLKAAFDTVDREILWEILEEMGISVYIIERLKGIYKETKVRVRAEEGLSEEFWTTKGLRQGCILSPILFCLYIAGLEERYENRNIGGTVVGNKRIWSLAYADDLVILAENREALLDMCDTLSFSER